MDDRELRDEFGELKDELERIREKLTQMQIADSEARMEVKIATGNLNNAANALANAAQSIQSKHLEAGAHPRVRPADKWLIRIALGAIVLAILAMGGKEIVAKMFGVNL